MNGFHFDLILVGLFLISLKMERMAKMKAYTIISTTLGSPFLRGDWGVQNGIQTNKNKKLRKMDKNLYCSKIIFYILILMNLLSCGSGEEKASGEAAHDKVNQEIPVGVALYSFNRFPFPETLEKSK